MSSASSTDSAPYLHANKFSRFIHHWISPLLEKSREQSTLYLNDLYDLPADLKSSTLTDKLEANWFDEIKRNPQKPSLIRATLRTLGWRPFLLGFLEILNSLVRIAQPLLLIFLMNFFEPCSTIPAWQAWLFAMATTIASLISGTIFNEYIYKTDLIAAQLRIAYMGLIFRKVLRLSSHSMNSLSSGEITNLISNDAKRVEVAFYLFNYIWCAFAVVGTVALVCVLNPWSLIPAGIGLCSMLIIRYRFAQCSRDLKRLDGTTRSPIYSHLTSTIHSLKVIRSYHAEQICSNEFLHHIDNHTRVHYLIVTTDRWAAIRFNWIAFIFLALVTFLALIIRIYQQEFSTAEIAITLFYSLNLLNFFQWSVRMTVYIETNMTAVQRVLEYCSLDQESPAQVSDKNRPPSNWPSHGCIVFENVSMCYSNDDDAPLALHNVSLTIEGGEKVGIVGRTGAGKNSFIQILFRMGILIDGQIRIDDINIEDIGLDDLRSRIAIIPKDPVLFSGTIRSNLDPFNNYSDDDIWNALEQVQLKTLVNDIMLNGLDSIVNESGSNLSVGQKQLICLGRAILKQCKILIIDEATANVNNATDELIQKAIREKFKQCTVLTIAHRLRTVLGNGELLEFDTPQALLSNSNSHFTSLIEQTGSTEAQFLRTLVNTQDTNMNFDEPNVDSDEELPLDPNENDPLLK
ncbi:unnamed protein product [Rotaria sp. Silwood1]|nr:unnamed protein product [Rotaria sp. Silwood1]